MARVHGTTPSVGPGVARFLALFVASSAIALAVLVPGGTAGAVRRLGDSGHIIKAQQRIRQIDNLLGRRLDLDIAERGTATRVRNDLADALRERGR